MKKDEMPKLMNDSSDKDGHAETIMDYVISWCLRRAQSICKKRSQSYILNVDICFLNY